MACRVDLAHGALASSLWVLDWPCVLAREPECPCTLEPVLRDDPMRALHAMHALCITCSMSSKQWPEYDACSTWGWAQHVHTAYSTAYSMCALHTAVQCMQCPTGLALQGGSRVSPRQAHRLAPCPRASVPGPFPASS